MTLILWHFCTSTGLLRRWPRRTQENFQWLTVKERRYCQDSFYLFCIFVSVSIQSERTACHTLVTSKKWNFVYTVRRRSIGGHLANIIFRPLIETAHMRMCSSQHRNAFILLLLVAKCTLSGGKTLALNGFMHKRRNYLSWDVSKQEALEKSVREFQRTRVQKKKTKTNNARSWITSKAWDHSTSITFNNCALFLLQSLPRTICNKWFSKLIFMCSSKEQRFNGSGSSWWKN